MEEIAAHTGISNAAVLSRVAGIGVSYDTLAAFNLVPLLAVAWGDNVMDQDERDAILLEAIAMGLKSSSNAYKLLESWLTRAPNPELVEAWKAFQGQLAPQLEDKARAELKSSILANAERVARASGGFLGIGAVSNEERSAIQELERLLS